MMKRYLLVLVLVAGLLFFGCTQPAPEPVPPAPEPTPEPTTPPLGSDRDEHGCIGSAGYEWCEPLQECIRPWETECKAPEVECTTVEDCGMGAASCIDGKCSQYDEHGCVPDGGYQWCESLGECIRPWETECPTTPMVGNDSDEHGCIGSAGYVWCESLSECVRPWETACVSLIKEQAEGFCNGENVASVSVCGDIIKVVSSLDGGGTTVYDAAGKELATCPVVSPTSMSPECTQYLMGSNCVDEEIC